MSEKEQLSELQKTYLDSLEQRYPKETKEELALDRITQVLPESQKEWQKDWLYESGGEKQ